MKQRVHFTAPYLLNPSHPVTVNVIGAGGTGCRVMNHLAALDTTLLALGHPGLQVTLFDPDEVSDANRGRQLFNHSEVGLNKAVAIISRINNYFGYEWRAVPDKFPASLETGADNFANITITCTDNVKSRLDVAKLLGEEMRWRDPYKEPFYWMDLGNSRTTGQVVLGTVGKGVEQPKPKGLTCVKKLKTITEMVDYTSVEVEDKGPSCSQAEALQHQDLYINPSLAVLGCGILWKMFREGRIDHHGLYLNLETLSMNPIRV